MNTNDTRFDRLVDDELSEEERRELLGRLDDEPGGWRRCALAFLDAQCWREVFGQVAASRSAGELLAGSAGVPPAQQEKAGGTPALPLEHARRSPWTGRLKLLSAMAASFLAALWIGSAANRAWIGHSGLPGTPNQFAGNANDVRPIPSPDWPESRLAVAPPSNSLAPDRWQTVTVSAPVQGRSPALVSVPAVERDKFDEQWMRSLPPAIPDDVMQALARTGHQVRQDREYVPVPMKDGRQLVVPVDHVKLHYVGNGPF
jgi:hypothetical protein